VLVQQNMKLKLYRGLVSTDFELLSEKKFQESRVVWRRILAKRAAGDFGYPQDMEAEIKKLAHIGRLEKQFFTDNKKIARAYAKAAKGQLVEISVSLTDLVKYFRLEFQNFGTRKKNFEIVYVVDAARLAKNRKKWRLVEERF